MTGPNEPLVPKPLRAADLLRNRRTLVSLAVIAGVVVALMTLVYFGSIVDPSAHLHGLPVDMVDQDSGAITPTGRIDLGQQVVAGLTDNAQITSRLAITVGSLSSARAQMDKGATFATVVIPKDFTQTILALAEGHDASPLPSIELLANVRAGSIGVSLAEGVLQPALASVSHSIGQRLEADAPSSAAPHALLADPITAVVTAYQPVPSHAGLGLSAFYFGLLTMMCGFLTAILINTSIDSDLGYATNEFGPRWEQKPLQRISRWQTLLTKWLIAIPLTLLTTGALMLVAAGILRMDAPHWFELWMYAWFAAVTIASGTLVFFAALGALGQLLALLVFVYLGLASSGGTIPIQALDGFFRFVANFEPLRQIVGAVRAILYFNAAGNAGLDRALALTSLGLVIWVVAGLTITFWYDKHGFDRMPAQDVSIGSGRSAKVVTRDGALDPTES
jgi:YhgE/Pip-like protein